MSFFFPEAGYTPLSTLKGLDAVDILVDLGTVLLVLACVRLTYSQSWLQFQHRFETSLALKSNEKSRVPIIIIAISAVIVAAVAVTFYFAHRLEHVLEVNDIDLTDTAYADTVHLQVQFMFGIISLTMLAVLFLYLAWQNNAYMTNEGKYDSVTGALVRRSFFASCSRAMRNTNRDSIGYFIMVDIDYFKDINDTYGHPEGDRALKEVAFALKSIFGQNTLIGRMGGDEFAALVCTDINVFDLKIKLDRFLENIHKITWADRCLTCSIGVLPVKTLRMPEDLYNDTDLFLYMAKEQGRDRYVIGEAD
jgi:diguanylate cyclase (GGDEF)-like protein